MFWMRLALNLGMTVRRLGEECDSAELSEWVAFDRIEPLPSPWLQTGILGSLMANLWKGPKNHKQYTPGDFMPIAKASKRPPKQTGAQIKSTMRKMAGKFFYPKNEEERVRMQAEAEAWTSSHAIGGRKKE